MASEEPETTDLYNYQITPVKDIKNSDSRIYKWEPGSRNRICMTSPVRYNIKRIVIGLSNGSIQLSSSLTVSGELFYPFCERDIPPDVVSEYPTHFVIGKKFILANNQDVLCHRITGDKIRSLVW